MPLEAMKLFYLYVLREITQAPDSFYIISSACYLHISLLFCILHIYTFLLLSVSCAFIVIVSKEKKKFVIKISESALVFSFFIILLIRDIFVLLFSSSAKIKAGRRVCKRCMCV